MTLDPPRIIGDCALLFAEVRRRVGDDWIVDAQTLSFEVTEQGDVVLHTGKGISFLFGKEESAGQVLAADRNMTPAMLSFVGVDGVFEEIGPVSLEE